MLFLRVIAWYGAEKFSLKKVVSIFTSGGTMSLVGTRPILQDELQKYELHHRARIAIKPGITGIEKLWGDKKLCEAYSKNCKNISLSSVLKSSLSFVEMKVSPLRALTHDHLFQFTWFYDVEMKVTS